MRPVPTLSKLAHKPSPFALTRLHTFRTLPLNHTHLSHSVHRAPFTSTTTHSSTSHSSPPPPPVFPLPLDSERRQLLYRAKQRGQLELDLILGSWASQHLALLNTEEFEQFKRLINEGENPDLIKWIIEKQPPPAQFDSPVLQRIIDYAQSEKGKQWFIKPGNQV